jgi:polysaccharide biosynthesis/export protein
MRHLPPGATMMKTRSERTRDHKVGTRRRFHATLAAISLIAGITAFWPRTASADDYKLSAGDVLEFSVAGAPDLQRKVSIGLEGTVSLPLIGEAPAAGVSIAQLRAEVRKLISQKEYRPHENYGGHQNSDVLWPDQITINVAEYRPIYLNGDVSKPGEQKFHPGMTIRQALSLAGGYDILRFRMDNPFLEAAELRSAYESAWIDYAREQARLARLRSELDAKAAAADSEAATPLPAELATRIRDAEQNYRRLHEGDFAKQRDHLKSLIDQQDVNIAALTTRHDTEKDGVQYDETEFKRIESLYKLGTLPMARVAEARRIMLLSATQALQSMVELERAKTERELTRRQSESLVDNRRMELTQSIQDSQTKLAALRTRIQALSEKLVYVGALKTQLARGTGGHPSLVLFRTGQPGKSVGEEAVLQPGDVVEVALHADETEQDASVPDR